MYLGICIVGVCSSRVEMNLPVWGMAYDILNTLLSGCSTGDSRKIELCKPTSELLPPNFVIIFGRNPNLTKKVFHLIHSSRWPLLLYIVQKIFILFSSILAKSDSIASEYTVAAILNYALQ